MPIHKKISTVIDAFEAYKVGRIVLLKSRVKDFKGNHYRIMRFANLMGSLRMFIELPNSDQFSVGTKELRFMGLELVSHEEVSRSPAA